MATIECRVRATAQEKGLTISALARQAHLNRKTVRRMWGSEMPRHVTFSTVTKLCHALGVDSVGELLIFVPDAPSHPKGE